MTALINILQPRDEIRIVPPDGCEVSATICRLVYNATLFQIFKSVGFPHLDPYFSDAQVDAFEEKHRSVFLDEDHATLLLRRRDYGNFDVVRFERDSCGDRFKFKLDHPHIWKAEDDHQVIVPTSVLELVRSQ